MNAKLQKKAFLANVERLRQIDGLSEIVADSKELTVSLDADELQKLFDELEDPRDSSDVERTANALVDLIEDLPVQLETVERPDLTHQESWDRLQEAIVEVYAKALEVVGAIEDLRD